MIRNLARRIEALEKASVDLRNRRQRMASNVLYRLPPEQLEALLSASAGVIRGRDLSTEESAAEQAFQQALSDACHSERLSADWCKSALKTIDFRDSDMIAIILAARMSASEIGVIISLNDGEDTVDVDTPEECIAIIEKYSKLMRNIERLAGLEAGPSQSENLF